MKHHGHQLSLSNLSQPFCGLIRVPFFSRPVIHGGRCTSAGDMADTWRKGFSAWYQVPDVIYWYRRSLGTLSEALALLYFVLADAYVEQRNQMIGFSVAAMLA